MARYRYIPIWQRVCLIALVFFIGGSIFKYNPEFVCENNINFCEIRTLNYFNVPQKQKILPPSSISMINVECSTHRYRNKHSFSHSYITTHSCEYEINLKNGKSVYVDNGTGNETTARNTSSEINKCLANKAFPCQFKL